MPVRFLIAACGIGLGISLVSMQLLSAQRSASGVLLLSGIAAAPVAAATAFLAFTPDRNLTVTLPAPSWLPHAVRLLAALPVIGLTAAVQFGVTQAELTPGPASAQPGHLSWAAWSAQFIAWLTVSTAAAAAVERTRWHDLGGTAAMPLALALIALVSVVPFRSLWSWWAITAAGAIVAVWQSRDPQR